MRVNIYHCKQKFGRISEYNIECKNPDTKQCDFIYIMCKRHCKNKQLVFFTVGITVPCEQWTLKGCY